jgi:hypothetical protein
VAEKDTGPSMSDERYLDVAVISVVTIIALWRIPRELEISDLAGISLILSGRNLNTRRAWDTDFLHLLGPPR